MTLDEALHGRSSIRAFLDRPVDDAILERVVSRALQSPSWANTQPYRLALANGADCERVRADMLAATNAGQMPSPDHDLLFAYPPELNARRRATGFGLYAALGIAREDRDRREAHFRENFAFFGAPAVAFLLAHRALGVYSVLDAGIFLQSLLLAIHAEGLGACAQASLASYPSIVRRHFDIPEEMRLLCGVSIGWPAEHPANTFRPERMTASELLLRPAGPLDVASAVEARADA